MLITTVPQGCRVAFYRSYAIRTFTHDELPGTPSIEVRVSEGFYWDTQYRRRCACKYSVTAKDWFPFPEIAAIVIEETAKDTDAGDTDAGDAAILCRAAVSILSAFMELAVYNGDTDYTAPLPLWLDILAHYVKGGII